MKFDFNDINLKPRKSIVDSRSQCDTSLKLGKFQFQLPIVPANMQAIIDEDIAIKLSEGGHFYIMHRFDIDVVEFIKKMKSFNFPTSISIGVNSDSYELINQLVELDLVPDYITIDIAHGHSIKMEKMLQFLKEKLPQTFLIAGNISTPEGVEDLQNWGADALKVGIGPGSACTTYPATGFGSRNCQAWTIYECAKIAKVPIIADGGIKVPGDITKSLVLGATMVMVGGLLAGQLDSPGKTIQIDGKPHKEFWGSASSHQSGKKNRIEGKKNLIPLKDKTISQEMNYLKECLQSSISYAGGKNLTVFEEVSWF
jgi:GMP reductase